MRVTEQQVQIYKEDFSLLYDDLHSVFDPNSSKVILHPATNHCRGGSTLLKLDSELCLRVIIKHRGYKSTCSFLMNLLYNASKKIDRLERECKNREGDILRMSKFHEDELRRQLDYYKKWGVSEYSTETKAESYPKIKVCGP